MINTERFVKGVSVKPSTALSTTSVDLAVAQSMKGNAIVFEVIDGNVWVEFDGTATASTGFLVTSDTGALHLTVGDHLSIISDATGAHYQYLHVKVGY